MPEKGIAGFMLVTPPRQSDEASFANRGETERPRKQAPVCWLRVFPPHAGAPTVGRPLFALICQRGLVARVTLGFLDLL